MTKKNTKNLLIESFLEIAKKKSVDKITVREISEVSGVTPQTFYNHFSDKYDMIYWHYRQRVDEVFTRFTNGEFDWKNALNEFLDGFRGNYRFILNAYKNTAGQDSYIDNTSIYIINRMEQAFKAKCDCEEVPFECSFYIEMYAVSLLHMVIAWLEGGMEIPQERLVELLYGGMPPQLKDYYYEGKILV